MDKTPKKSSPAAATTANRAAKAINSPSRSRSPSSRLFPKSSTTESSHLSVPGRWASHTSVGSQDASTLQIASQESHLEDAMATLNLPSEPITISSYIPASLGDLASAVGSAPGSLMSIMSLLPTTKPATPQPNPLFVREKLTQHRAQTLNMSQDGLTALSGVVRSMLRGTNATEELNRAARIFSYTTDRAMGVLETGSEYLTGSGPGGLGKTLDVTARTTAVWEERIRGQKSSLLLADDIWEDLDFRGRRRRARTSQTTEAVGFG